ncbi:MAG: hypothetical protein IMW86_03010 [Hydrogenibacillus sp.]|nr:hypothetical protein [Hydrogenibacillus sp.]
MKLEFVEAQLKKWGEIILRLDSGETLEIHLGDTTFDYDNRLLHFRGGDALYYIDADKIESLKMHYSHIESE